MTDYLILAFVAMIGGGLGILALHEARKYRARMDAKKQDIKKQDIIS